MKGEPLSPLCASISLFLLISSSLFNLQPPHHFIPLSPLSFISPVFITPPPSVVTRLKEGTESKVCGVPRQTLQCRLLRSRHSAGRQAGRHTELVCHILSLIFNSYRNCNLIKDTASRINPGRRVNRKKKGGKEGNWGKW